LVSNPYMVEGGQALIQLFLNRFSNSLLVRRGQGFL
jgi:hypothetical protein